MYAKVFESIYDGTLVENWQALVTFQQMLVLCDAEGFIDMTPRALSNRTGIPFEIIEVGITHLEAPDRSSRTPDMDGCRIERIDDHRAWGWRIVNYIKYREMRDEEKRREQNREAQQRRRDRQQASASVSFGKPLSAESAYAEEEVEEDKDLTTLSGKPDVYPLESPKPEKGKGAFREQAREVIYFLNSKTGRHYEPCEANVGFVVARLKGGASMKQLRQVVAMKTREWIGDPKMNKYLRPATLFNREKFAQYVGELGANQPEGENHVPAMP